MPSLATIRLNELANVTYKNLKNLATAASGMRPHLPCVMLIQSVGCTMLLYKKPPVHRAFPTKPYPAAPYDMACDAKPAHNRDIPLRLLSGREEVCRPDSG
jgi:hypothetical protein